MSVYRSEAGKTAIRRFVASYYAACRCTERFVPTTFGDTHVLSAGPADAPPVVLLHGSASNALSWLGLMPRLAERYRVYAPDMPGEPGLSADCRLSLASGEPQAWLGEVLSALAVDRLAVVGNSLGGWLALNMASALPSRIAALALLAPSGLAKARASFVWQALGLLLLGPLGRRQLNRLIFRDACIPSEVAAFCALSARTFKPLTEPVPVLTDKALANLVMPVLYIAGGRDALLNTPASQRRLMALVPHATTRVRPEGGHAIMDGDGDVVEFLVEQYVC